MHFWGAFKKEGKTYSQDRLAGRSFSLTVYPHNLASFDQPSVGARRGAAGEGLVEMRKKVEAF